MSLKINNLFLYLSAIIGNLLSFSTGIAFSWTSPMLPKLEQLENNPLGRPVTLIEKSWISALVSLGSLIGQPIAGLIAHKYGRKKTLLIMACPIFLSLLMMAFANSVIILYIARLIAGLGAGSVFTIVPMYLVEISEVHNRGAISCLMSIFASSGILFTYVVGPVLSVQNFCLICLTPLIIFIPAFIFLNPETPHFLASVNDNLNLKKSLIKLRKRKTIEEVETEASEIQKTIEELNQNKANITDLFTKQILRRGLIISCVIISLQQFGGIVAVISYMQEIFKAAGSGLSDEISVIIIGFAQLCVTIVTSSLVDVLGRRILLLVSTIGSFLSLFSLGLFFYLKTNNYDVSFLSFLPIASLFVYIITFNIGLGPLPWTIMAEIFPTNVKATATSVISFVCFVENFTVMMCFPSISAAIGMGMTFWIFALVCLFGIGFVLLVLPETKGKTLIEIQKLLESKNSSLK